ncbi:MAG: S-layer homology domain-containing protein [Cyanobacteria bacterium P01_A01_bin.114]
MSQFSPDRNPEPRRRRLVSSDELIALFVAFTTLGSVLFWGLTRSGVDVLSNDALRFAGRDGSRAGLADADRQAGRLGLGTLDQGSDADTVPFGERQRGAAAPAQSNAPAADSRDRSVAQLDSASQSPRPSAPSGAVIAPPADVSLPRQEAVQPTEPVIPDLAPVRESLLFQDVPDGYWAKPYVDALSARGLIQGLEEGAFKPDDPVTRAQLARFLNQSFPMTPETDAINFNDVFADYWAADSIRDAVVGGFMVGFPDDTFRPEDQVPRAQVLTALVTGLDTQAAGDVKAVIDRYADADEIPEWAEGKMAAATQAGIVVNHPEISQLSPNQSATRAEVAAMLYQALVYQGRLEPLASESDYVVKP